ncbi:MAG: 2-hydroxycarboxylate transporter family protein [Sphaerochaetaceae bacterium]
MSFLKEKKVLGFPVWMFSILCAMMIFLGAKDWLLGNMIGALCFAMIIGNLFGVVGDNIPVWKTWCGGGMLFACLAAGALNTFKLIGPNTIKILNTFNGSTGFLDLYILVLITGSVLSVDRKMLVKSFAGYLPTILGGVVCALGLAALVGLVTGVGAVDALTNFAIPVMGGGNGAGIQPMSKMWAAATGGDASVWFASEFAVISIGNLFAVIAAALLVRFGSGKPNFNGEGKLMKGQFDEESSTKTEVKIGPADYATGLALAMFCFILAGLYADHISIINNHMSLGFTIHKYAFMVILVAILNITNILPEEIKAGAHGIQMFFVKYMSFPLMITVGVGTNLADYAKVFVHPGNVLVILATVIGAMAGTWFVGKLFKFYPVESMITAGLCMANGGGSGDVQVLGASKRMELMPYAQISSRIGGAIMLVIASVAFGKLL